ncbi:MAG: 23S rRNA (pseudouridine(1915)-N(3))-methyltransferase RlmH [Acidobacteriaceae bacterium]
MEIRLITLGRRATRKHGSAEEMFAAYVERIGHYARCQAESFPTEGKLFSAIDRSSGRVPLLAVLLDSRGKSWGTEAFAAWLRKQRDEGAQQIAFAVGPADGWSEVAVRRAGLLLSLGPMTLPHELAAVVLAEQIYRAFTIIEGHPYHLGHAPK